MDPVVSYVLGDSDMAKSIIRNVVWVIAFFLVFGTVAHTEIIYEGEGEARRILWFPFVLLIVVAALFANSLDKLLQRRM